MGEFKSFVDIVTPDERFWIEVGGARFLCRRLSDDDRRRLEKKNFPKGRQGMSEQKQRWAEEALQKDWIDWILQDWDGVGAMGEPALCTRENKWALPEVVKDELWRKVNAKMTAEDEAEAAAQKEEEKNL